MNVSQIQSDLAALAAQVQPLVAKSKAGTLTHEEDAEFDSLVERINNAKSALVKAEAREQATSEIITLNRDYNAPVKTGRDVVHPEAQGIDENGNTVRSLTIGQKFSRSAEFKNRNSSGLMATGMKLNGMFPEYARNANPEEIKAVIGSAGVSASALFADVIPGVYRGAEQPLVLRDVLLNMSTQSDNITVMQENIFTNSAVEVSEATAVNGSGVSGGVKPESAITFTEATFPVRTIAHWVPITRQLLEDTPFMESYIDERLRQGLKRREDGQFLNGDGAAPNIRGILQTSGINALDGTYFTANPVEDAGAGNENLNRIRRAKTVVQNTGLAVPTFVVVNPADAEVLDTVSDTNGAYLLGGPLAGSQRRIWGLPVVESSYITEGIALVGDGTMAAIVDRNDAQVLTSDSHSDYFVRNLMVLLAEERLALAVFRALAFASVTLV